MVPASCGLSSWASSVPRFGAGPGGFCSDGVRGVRGVWEPGDGCHQRCAEGHAHGEGRGEQPCGAQIDIKVGGYCGKQAREHEF